MARHPAVDVNGDEAHGRVESRTVTIVAISTGIKFPHARSAIQVTRRTPTMTSRMCETVHVITDLDQTQIRPQQVVDTLRGQCEVFSPG